MVIKSSKENPAVKTNTLTRVVKQTIKTLFC